MSIEPAFETVRSAHEACIECGSCIKRCEVLRDVPDRSVGGIAGAVSALAPEGISDEASRLAFLKAVDELAQDDPLLIFAIRRCCMCEYCTLDCPVHIQARSVFVALREILSSAGVTTTVGFESTQVDKEWHIFSVYRAVYGIYYVDLPHMDQARELGADTLFFPGCPLVSYAPELTREVFGYLGSHGINAVISEDCCGSPLKSAGFGSRARAFKKRIAEQVQAAGIKRIICVCPGCQKELQGAAPSMAGVEFQPLPEVLCQTGAAISPSELYAAVAYYLGEGAASSPDDVRVAFFDSCYDRDQCFGGPLRKLFPKENILEMEHSGANAICCGAGGAVSLVDPDISVARAQRVLDEGARSKADLIITNCPTCAYTLAFQVRSYGRPQGYPANVHYLELLFENRFDWDLVFSQLEGMWSGEYGPWVMQQLS